MEGKNGIEAIDNDAQCRLPSQPESLTKQVVVVPDSVTSIALCGGPYSNFVAVEQFLRETADIGHRFCLGDMGGFGAFPDRSIDQLKESGVVALQGNYDYSVGHGERDCGCGYTDERDRQFAQISYDYTLANTSAENREWLKSLPQLIELRWRSRRLLLCHGSPNCVNEFVWETEAADAQIERWLTEFDVQGICATHSGLPWVRQISHGFWCNIGVLGRPPHDGQPRVYYARLDFPTAADGPVPQLVPMTYDTEAAIAAMRSEGLPEEFCDSLQSGIWTTCAEILPPQERDVRPRWAMAQIT
ncbi:MAG: metallophosphoesterase [Cyanobacteria bacterium P01_E01_bin.34]